MIVRCGSSSYHVQVQFQAMTFAAGAAALTPALIRAMTSATTSWGERRAQRGQVT